MHFSNLYSLPLAVAFAAQALQVSAAGSFVPVGVGHADSALIENQRLYISDGSRFEGGAMIPNVPQFVSLDLATAWTSDAPAWTNHTRRTTSENDYQGLAALTKDNSSILFFSGNSAYQYNVKTDTWANDPYKSWNYTAFGRGGVTDIDSGLIYGIEALPARGGQGGNWTAPASWKFTGFDPTTKDSSFVEQKEPRDITTAWRTLVYSKAAKTIYSYDNTTPEDLTTPIVRLDQFMSYNIASKRWSTVNATGDIPSPRDTPCLVTAHDGKKLILAGGTDMKGLNLSNDVYSFDVATSVWSKLANAPRAAWGPVCAVSGDSFIFWGGLGTKEGLGFNHEEGPAILNIVSNTWGNKYTPPGQTPSSSADRPNVILSRVGLVALTVASAAVSGLIL